ncbi:hypothetical protein HDV05_005073 [Chytridiales sp. JEL 0842]|nr:hypothetical protein HDV05_005073 [Chytridiales sp. JEL 0842]
MAPIDPHSLISALRRNVVSIANETITVAASAPSPAPEVFARQDSLNQTGPKILTPTEQTIIYFSAYMTLQGFFLGTTVLFLWRGTKLYLSKRNWLTLSNVAQLLLYAIRQLIIITFNVAPGTSVDCSWRQYAAGVVSSAVVVTCWWLQYIKFAAMYKDRPWVRGIVMGVCLACLAAVFPFLRTKIELNSLGYCTVSFDANMQVAYIAVDVFVNLLLGLLFSIAIYSHISTTDRTWTSYSKLSYILTCDVRASFIDTIAQCVKLALNLSPIPGSQTVFGAHICDWVKVAAAHWFVNDVVSQDSRDNLGSTGTHQCSACSKTMTQSHSSGGPNVLVSIRRKASISAPKVLDKDGNPVTSNRKGSVGTLASPFRSVPDNLNNDNRTAHLGVPATAVILGTAMYGGSTPNVGEPGGRNSVGGRNSLGGSGEVVRSGGTLGDSHPGSSEV